MAGGETVLKLLKSVYNFKTATEEVKQQAYLFSEVVEAVSWYLDKVDTKSEARDLVLKTVEGLRDELERTNGLMNSSA